MESASTARAYFSKIGPARVDLEGPRRGIPSTHSPTVVFQFWEWRQATGIAPVKTEVIGPTA